jgi:hypothetical protein
MHTFPALADPTYLFRWCTVSRYVHPAIPVGIAVARQRLKDHTLPSSGAKPDMKPPQAASCRQQKALAPAPPEPQCSAADIVPAPIPPSLSAMGELNDISVSLVLCRVSKTAYFWVVLYLMLKMLAVLVTVGWIPWRIRIFEYTKVTYGLLLLWNIPK